MLAALLPGPAGPASAERTNADAKPQANALLAEARQLYEEGNYGGALDRLNRAYAAFPSPAIRFNFAQIYRALLRDVEAIESFERFLNEGTDQDPALRREADVYLLELNRRVGEIEITANVDGASIHVDGKPYGPTPLKRPIRVMPGAHQILVQGQGAVLPFIGRIEVAPGETARVDAKLVPTPGPTGLVAGSAPSSETRPIYKRWWFWTGVGAVVAGAVVTTVLVVNTRDSCAYNAGCITFP